MKNKGKKSLYVVGFGFIVMVVIIGFYSSGYLKKGEQDYRDNRPRKFGATYMTMDNPYFEVLNDRIKEIVEANGDRLITRDPAQDQAKQNLQVQDMIDEGVVAIFINPADWKAVKPALKACWEAEIPVFNVDTYVYDLDYIVSSMVSDNYAAGVECAKDVMKKREYANIVILNHPNMNSIIERVQGFLDTIAENDHYKVVVQESAGAELEIAMAVMNRIIDEGIEFDVIMGGNDPMALGALAALQSNDIDENILIYGVDGSPDGKAMIKAGYLEGSSAQYPIIIGTIAAETAYAYLNGEEVERTMVIPITLITKENLEDFNITSWQ